MNASRTRFWTTPKGMAAIGLIVAVSYFVLTEHRAHFIYALPFLVLLLCLAMCVLMHRGDRHEHSECYPRHGKEGE